ncbi:hypothetical protein M9H77_06306 [Catharanthus roseus]|uniref:Uncharacterized protein n=1 Tax=Catharanthus roseus TaxID=4058 RepID=A0ACC0BRX8_CATRO|nr:hypothetical protein M9H77_06306 [Catharanthus roseus]
MDTARMAQFQNFSLKGFEKISIKIAELDFGVGMEEYSLCCVRRFIWGKTINVKVYCCVMCQVWGCLDLNIVKLHDRVHQLFFPNEDSHKKALELDPWCFYIYLFIINPWDPAMEDVNYDFAGLLTACPFMFHIAHLSRGHHTVKVAYKITPSLTD